VVIAAIGAAIGVVNLMDRMDSVSESG
jgi:hypothetical protein